MGSILIKVIIFREIMAGNYSQGIWEKLGAASWIIVRELSPKSSGSWEIRGITIYRKIGKVGKSEGTSRSFIFQNNESQGNFGGNRFLGKVEQVSMALLGLAPKKLDLGKLMVTTPGEAGKGWGRPMENLP